MRDTYVALSIALNATSQRRCGDETGLRVVATNTTNINININTKYTTLQHVPSKRASLWAVGSLGVDHRSTKHTSRVDWGGEGRITKRKSREE